MKKTRIIKIERDKKNHRITWIMEERGFPPFTENEILYWGMKYWPRLFGIKELAV